MVSQGHTERNQHSQEPFHGNGFKIERRLFSPETSKKPSSCHTLQLNDGAQIQLSWKSQDILATSICEPGDFVQLTSAGEPDYFQCDQSYYAIELSFHAAFIDKIMEKENFTFDPRCNFHDPLLSSLVTNLYSCAYSQTAEILYTQSLAVVCAIHLATTYKVSNKQVFSLKGKLSSSQSQRVIRFIRETINRTVTLEELAMCCHLSVFHFSRLFKNTLGISPYQYVLRSKIEHAGNLMKSKRAVGDIAYSLGFTDSAHFCNAFKRFTGHSPLQYVAKRQALGMTV